VSSYRLHSQSISCTYVGTAETKPISTKAELWNLYSMQLGIAIFACYIIRFIIYYLHTHTQPFNALLSGTTLVGWYQKKHSRTHTHPDHRTSFIIFLHLQRSMASSLFSLRAWQSSRTTSLQVLFGLPLGLWPSIISYSMHFFTQSSSSFRSNAHTNQWSFR